MEQLRKRFILLREADLGAIGSHLAQRTQEVLRMFVMSGAVESKKGRTYFGLSGNQVPASRLERPKGPNNFE